MPAGLKRCFMPRFRNRRKENDMATIEREIKQKFAAGMKTNASIYHSDHSVPPQVSWETYKGVIELVKKYGQYER